MWSQGCPLALNWSREVAFIMAPVCRSSRLRRASAVAPDYADYDVIFGGIVDPPSYSRRLLQQIVCADFQARHLLPIGRAMCLQMFLGTGFSRSTSVAGIE